MTDKSKFGTIGLNAGFVGRLLRLLFGIGSIGYTFYLDILNPSTFNFYLQGVFYFAVILIVLIKIVLLQFFLE